MKARALVSYSSGSGDGACTAASASTVAARRARGAAAAAPAVRSAPDRVKVTALQSAERGIIVPIFLQRCVKGRPGGRRGRGLNQAEVNSAVPPPLSAHRPSR